jgi:hypothetical protein
MLILSGGIEELERGGIDELHHDGEADDDEGDAEQQCNERAQHLHRRLICWLLGAQEAFLPPLARLIGEHIAQRAAGFFRLRDQRHEVVDGRHHDARCEPVECAPTSHAGTRLSKIPLELLLRRSGLQWLDRLLDGGG